MNIRSMRKNFDNFLVTLKRLDLDFDAIVFSECWLNEFVTVPLLQGFTSFYSQKYINRAGGVAIYIRDRWSANFSELNVDEGNCILAEVANHFSVVAAYRSPSYTNPEIFIRSLDANLKTVSPSPCLIFAGDINLNIIGSAADINLHTEYLDVLAEYGLFPAITKPTRVQTCIDHIFVPVKSNAESVVYLNAATDHDITMAGIMLKTHKPKRPKPIRSRVIVDIDSIRSELEGTDWSTVINCSFLEESVTHFTKTVSEAILRYSKTCVISRSRTTLHPWMTPGLIRCSKHRDKLHIEYRKDPNNPTKKLIYTRYRNFYIDLIRRLKRDYNKKEIIKNKYAPKKLWGTINRITGKDTSSSSNLALINSRPSVKESLNVCNSYFVSVGNKLANSIMLKLNETQESLAEKVHIPDQPVGSFFMNPTDELEVLGLIRSLDSGAMLLQQNSSNEIIRL
ncbi:unnamed protein product [Parnassius apollo]|uniref:(apollo) hypothetical protein n=1 Tax=Parnassius apollo TaxID=110799 RepID=A0A8S3WH10_PARAO|nr:unnamed protein product [Parnassius apollo]